jgi:hypothetical protein
MRKLAMPLTPVIFPPGRARVSTNPARTASAIDVITMDLQ